MIRFIFEKTESMGKDGVRKSLFTHDINSMEDINEVEKIMSSGGSSSYDYYEFTNVIGIESLNKSQPENLEI